MQEQGSHQLRMQKMQTQSMHDMRCGIQLEMPQMQLKYNIN